MGSTRAYHHLSPPGEQVRWSRLFDTWACLGLRPEAPFDSYDFDDVDPSARRRWTAKELTVSLLSEELLAWAVWAPEQELRGARCSLYLSQRGWSELRDTARYEVILLKAASLCGAPLLLVEETASGLSENFGWVEGKLLFEPHQGANGEPRRLRVYCALGREELLEELPAVAWTGRAIHGVEGFREATLEIASANWR